MGNSATAKYTAMQRGFYDDLPLTPEDIVGNYDYNENFPYETLLLYKNGDIRKPIFQSTSDKRALDIACGEGRMIRRMGKFFGAVDGVDISGKMVDAAQKRCPESQIFFLTNGISCGDAPTSQYDFAYCTISLHHICVHEVRESILKDVVRVLKPGGSLTLQFIFSQFFPYVPTGHKLVKVGDQETLVQIYTKTGQHAEWMENRYDATSTNGDCDVSFGENDIPLVKADLEKNFKKCEMWFYDISIGRGGNPRILAPSHPNGGITNSYSSYYGTHFAFIHCSGPKK